MRALKRFFARIRNFVVSRHGDERLREEMEWHIALQTEENVRAGMPPAEARRRVLIKSVALKRSERTTRPRKACRFSRGCFRTYDSHCA